MSALLEPFIHEPPIAYFSMEIALRSEIPTYSGGLGVLAGDTMRSAADLDLPMIGVTLARRAGYDRAGWAAVMKGAITRNASFFNSHRMMRRYAVEAYLR